MIPCSFSFPVRPSVPGADRCHAGRRLSGAIGGVPVVGQGCAGGERCRPQPGPVAGEVMADGPGPERREGGGGVPGRGGTRGGAGGGGAGGSLKEAEISASNSASTHC